MQSTPQNNKHRFARTYWIAGAVGAFFLTVCILFLTEMSRFNKQENLNFLKEAGKQDKLAIINHIGNDFEKLSGVATCIGSIQSWPSEQLIKILQEINNTNSFLRMGLADVNGNADMLDLEGQVFADVDFSEADFFRRALSGENAISDPIFDADADCKVNYIAVPVYQGDTVIGALCAVNKTNIYSDIAGSSIFNGQGFVSIVNSAGQYMVNTQHPNAVSGVRTLEDIGKFKNGVLSAVKSDLQAGNSGFFLYQNTDGQDRWAYYEPLGINDWSILSVVPQAAFKQLFNSTMIFVSAFIAASYALFLLLLFHIQRITAKTQKKLEDIAYTDALTGDRNHVKFLNDAYLILCGSRDRNYAVWYFNIQNFKFINDIFGYDTGDQILRALSGWLASNCGKTGLFCRSSADHFEGVVPYSDMAQLQDWIRSFLSELPEISMAAAGKYQIEASIGIYCLEKSDELPPMNNMLDWANMAQKSVRPGDGGFAFYSDEIRQRAHREAELLSHMQEALDAGEFSLYLQPKIDILNGNRIAGAEALVRWESKSQGKIPPSEFIPLFERNGFIIKLDRYMFQMVCKYLRGRIDSGLPELSISVNVSRLALFQKDFVEFYTKTKKEYQIPDGLLDLEFTESIVFQDSVFFNKTVKILQKNGFLCSMDDFGSGYSSLNVLKDISIDILKLDMLFFHGSHSDPKREQIVISNIIAMARELHIVTIAEGVEHIGQVDFLRRVGCNLIQGYTFSKPLPYAEFDRLYQNSQGHLEPEEAAS